MNCTPVFKKVVKANQMMNTLDANTVNKVLLLVADAAVKNSDLILSENRKDLIRMDESDPRYDRLKLTESRIKSIAGDIRKVSGLQSPLGRIISDATMPNGLRISRISVPFGVIGIIYEARPNVTFDVFSLCFKSGNACILKGGSDAINSNTAIVRIIRSILEENNINPDVLTLLPAGRSETAQLLNARHYVDLIIPRGSRNLIDFVRENATIPVIETGAGICHTYFDEFGDREKGRLIIHNAKTRRVSVCNALDCLVIHEKRLGDLEHLVGLCESSDVVIYADSKAYRFLKGKYPSHLLKKADRSSFGTEFLSYKMAVKTVSSFDEAVFHINLFGSKHSEAIISENKKRIELFNRSVDASSVYANTSTAFTDGAEFGLGAEIGISTQKLHARGPMALEALTTYKWIIEGDGQIRN
ncbi:MAG: glutamate-5-semialdehyde dehydrogenase [Bacteroidetes bacterium GWE2_41_25]|nr:MAG: glutamate-5-semialdehyde dehydrogenase [Bacteroidetes bacterium GWA2_40_15]OFX93880.1 MAG: glutamate-5-semialdehyde dehydrogenase [Bacteroidetes bacterium GWE2_41_25]OFX99537.1 MAG: glutamate-5-semialdehyde dehydrogenase [Bacteroidetes bacterium GWC2_40_22]OFY56745.1 MAG: glutamate-5-semialdehyde dehydrogenase [Bacteroidetes bacterium GWF2_41_9]HAM10979.1 glutamate-5-semialdehyde dehydrogenase [Bacteroidales bacterium]